MIGANDRLYLRVLARDVPPVGYKVYEIRPGAGSSFAAAAQASEDVLENDFYRLRVAGNGAVTSLIDKTRGNREFAREFDGGFINDLGGRAGRVRVENSGPVSVTLLAEADEPVAHRTRITLRRDSNRIDVYNEILENFSEVLTWNFGFNLDDPDVWHEEVGAVIRARLLDDGGHYAPSHARYDWQTLNHFADMSGGDGVGITLSNADCYYVRLGGSERDHLDVNSPQLSVLAGGQVDGRRLGIRAQDGDSSFLQRFALQTRDTFDPAAAMRFALEHQNPLLAAEITGGDYYPETAYSLASIDHPAVLLWALKPAEDGIQNGIVARMWNLAAEPADLTLALSPGRTTAAAHISHIETYIEDADVVDGALSATLAANQLKTFLLRL
jgi:alpha-mannosidase